MQAISACINQIIASLKSLYVARFNLYDVKVDLNVANTSNPRQGNLFAIIKN